MILEKSRSTKACGQRKKPAAIHSFIIYQALELLI